MMRSLARNLAGKLARGGGDASSVPWWSYAPGLTVDTLKSLPFYSSLAAPPLPPTINPANFVEVTTAVGFNTVCDLLGQSIETEVHIAASFTGNIYANASDVLVTFAPGAVVNGQFSVNSANLGCARVEVDGGDYPLALRGTIRNAGALIGGDPGFPPSNVVHRRLNFWCTGNFLNQAATRSAYVDCRINCGYGFFLTPAAAVVSSDFFILGCNVHTTDAAGSEPLYLDHATTATSLRRIVVWNTDLSSGGGVAAYREVTIGRATDVAVLNSTLRVRAISHLLAVGTNIIYRNNLVHTDDVPNGAAEPAYWEWSGNSWYGVTEAAFTTAMGTPDVFTANSFQDAYVAPAEWPLAPGDPALADGLDGTTALGADALHAWMVPPDDTSAASGSGPLLTLNGTNVSQLNPIAGAANLVQATAGKQPAYSASGGVDDCAYVNIQAISRLLSATIAVAAANRTGVYVVAEQSNTSDERYVALTFGAEIAQAFVRNATTGFKHYIRFTGGGQFIELTDPALNTAWHLRAVLPYAAGAVSAFDGVTTTPSFTGTDTVIALTTASFGQAGAENAGAGSIAFMLLVADATAAKDITVRRFVRENFPGLGVAA